jgi:DNA replication protein DnaC
MSINQMEAFKSAFLDRKSCFITGGAGSGKSFVIQLLAKALDCKKTAFTGCI